MNRTIAAVVVSTGVLVSAQALGREVGVEITNLTHGTYFTPLLVAAVDRDTHLFQAGTVASANLVRLSSE